MAFATLGALFLSKFTEAATLTFLFVLSEWLEVRATSRARDALSSIVNLRPDRANLVHPQTKELIEVPATAVPLGAMVVVRAGGKIPCDGTIVEGTSTVDESSLTGENKPVKKCVDDNVSGGTINSGNSQLVVQTTRTSDDSAVSRLIRLVEEAQANRSETEKIIDSFARVYTPVVVLLASIMCTLPWAWGSEVGKFWFSQGLVLVVVVSSSFENAHIFLDTIMYVR
jgi:Zn2+/Cd2+-exporting ATPase